MSYSEAYDPEEGIAIVGMAGRFPGARNVAQLWRNLLEGRETISHFRADELDAAPAGELAARDNPAYVRAHGILDDIEMFAAGFFGINPKEAEILDPQQRVFLETAWEALEDAGYDPQRFSGLIGVFAGASDNTYFLQNLLNRRDVTDFVNALTMMTSNEKDYLTTRVAYKLDLKGPTLNIQTACSTSLVAVCSAVQSLLSYQCDMALAGGVSIALPQRSGYLWYEGAITSPDGHCRAFDADAQGTVFGNGVGIVVLRRLRDARASGDTIYAVIKGTALNNDGSAKVSFTAPSVDGQAHVISMAQALGGIDPETVSYIEAHGTGTPLGDPIEIAGLTQAFRAGGARGNAFCAIGSLKTNIGHLDAAAGVGGLIKATLSLHHKLLPASLHFKSPNPKLGLEDSPFYVNVGLRPWKSGVTPRRAGVSSFGVGGTNAHVVLEEAPAQEPSGRSREWQLLCLSAKTDTALAQATENLARYLGEHPDINLADAAYTLQIGREEFSHRRVVVCRDAADAASALESGAPERVIGGFHKGGERSVVFTFSGQGAQYPNMGLGLYQTENVFRELVDQCCEKLKQHLDLDLRDVLFPAEDARESAAERLKQTELTQPALFVIEYALAQLWMSLGIRPAAMIGHSIGEYVAACLAGVMSLDDALGLVAERGRLMGQLPAGSMLAVPLSEAEVLPLLSEQLSIASINSPSLCVVSGPEADIAELEARLIKMELALRRLHTSHAFHSSMMAPILEPFTKRVSAITLNPPQVPYISDVTGNWITAEQAMDPAYYATHLRQAVQFAKGLEQLFADPNRVFLEVGPGSTLTALAKWHPAKKNEHAFVASMRHHDERRADEAVLMDSMGRLWLAGVRPDWSALHAKQHRRRMRLPTYPFERQKYWVEPGKERGPVGVLGVLRKKSDIAEWLYVPSWKRAPAPSAMPGKRGTSWLLFTDHHGLGSQLEAELIAGGTKVASVALGKRFAMNGPGKFALNPAAREDYDRLVAELKANSFTPEIIVHLWSVSRDKELRKDTDYLAGCKDRGFFSVVFLAQALEAAGLNAPLGLAVLTTHTQEVNGDEVVCPEKAMVLGPCKVIGMEHPHIRTRSIDVTADGDLQWLARALTADLCAPWTEPVVAYRGRYRWVQAFEQVRLEPPTGRPATLRDSGVYLITGGLGGVGLEIADYLARTAGARLALVGRTELPAREQWTRWLAEHDQIDGTSRKIRRVQAIEAEGGEVLVCKADVANERQMVAAIAAAEARFGPLCGVMHAAGAEKHGVPIQSLRRSDCEEQFRPKLQGLRVLEKVLRGKSLDFCVVHSSLASVMGVMGFVSYTAAHLFMDAFVHRHNREAGTPWRIVNWDNWALGDERTEGLNFAHTEFYMVPREAADALGRLLSMTDGTQVLVSTGDLQGRIDQWISREKPQAGKTQADEDVPASHGHPRPALSSKYEAPRNDAERLLANIWREMFGIDQVGIHDNFFELGGHSLMIIRLIQEIKRTHQVSLGAPELFQNPTVEQMASVINGRQPKSKRHPAVVQLQKGRAGLPVYFIYAGPDEIRLGKLINERHPVFGIEVPWPMAWREAMAAYWRSAFTMEQLVAPYVTALADHVGSSACVLAGHSFAGLMAFEAAHQFQNKGGKVEMVILLDTQARYAYPLEAAWIIFQQTWLKRFDRRSAGRQSTSVVSRLRLSLRIVRWLLREEKARVLSFVKRLASNRTALDPENLTTILDEQGTPVPREFLRRLHIAVGVAYRLRRLDSRGVLFRSDEMSDINNVQSLDDSLGWTNLFTRGLEIIPVFGDHLSMIREHYRTLAQKMNEVLHRMPSQNAFEETTETRGSKEVSWRRPQEIGQRVE